VDGLGQTRQEGMAPPYDPTEHVVSGQIPVTKVGGRARGTSDEV
jgi:hypothetical protein